MRFGPRCILTSAVPFYFSIYRYLPAQLWRHADVLLHPLKRGTHIFTLETKSRHSRLWKVALISLQQDLKAIPMPLCPLQLHFARVILKGTTEEVFKTEALDISAAQKFHSGLGRVVQTP